MLRFAFASCAVFFGTAAFASFELVMVADRGTKSVHRFDGTTGLYMGQFGNGYLQNPMSIALDQANNRVFVLDQVGTGSGGSGAAVRIWSFNYNTGEYLNNFSSPPGFAYVQPQIAYRNSSVWIGHDGRFVDLLSDSGNSLGSVGWTGASNPKGLAVDSVGNLWAVEGNQMYRRTSGGSQTAFTMNGPVGNSSTPGQRQLAISGTRALAVGAISFSTFDTSSLSASNPANAMTSTTVTSYLQLNGAGFGHGNIAYITGVNGSGTNGSISRILYNENLVLQTFGSGVLVEPRSMAVVVAPEPGSMIALGLGLAAILRRRRRA